MAVEIRPRKLRGPWTEGYALDVHTTKSVFVGHDAYGRAVFETTRSPLGELLYRLKYGGDPTALKEIAETVVGFLRKWNPSVDALVPVPPSNVLTGAFTVDRAQTSERRLLLFDDLYRSGATAGAITKSLLMEGAAAAVYLLTLTWTRRTV